MHTKFLNNLKITFYCWQHIPSQNQNVKAPLTLFSAAVANQPSASRAWLSKSIYNLFLTFSDKSNEIFSMWQLCTESNIWTCVCMVNPSLLCPCPHSPFHWPQRERERGIKKKKKIKAEGGSKWFYKMKKKKKKRERDHTREMKTLKSVFNKTYFNTKSLPK